MKQIAHDSSVLLKNVPWLHCDPEFTDLFLKNTYFLCINHELMPLPYKLTFSLSWLIIKQIRSPELIMQIGYA